MCGCAHSVCLLEGTFLDSAFCKAVWCKGWPFQQFLASSLPCGKGNVDPNGKGMGQNSFHTQSILGSHISHQYPLQFILRAPCGWNLVRFVFSSSKWWSALCRVWRDTAGDGEQEDGQVGRDPEGGWAEGVFNKWLMIASVCFCNFSQIFVTNPFIFIHRAI